MKKIKVDNNHIENNIIHDWEEAFDLHIKGKSIKGDYSLRIHYTNPHTLYTYIEVVNGVELENGYKYVFHTIEDEEINKTTFILDEKDTLVSLINELNGR